MTAVEVTTINFQQKVASDANTIFLIDCLSENDKQSARIRHEGICDTLMAQSTQGIFHDTSRVYHVQCKYQGDWSTAMSKIRDACKKGLIPLVFIDGHGDAEKGLAMPLGGFIGWQEYGQDLRAITDAACGELTVVAGFCHSFAFVEKAAQMTEKLPFAFYFGYKDEVLTSVVEDESRLIYESLINDGGQFLDSIALQISKYDEYDHATKLIRQVILMEIAPEALRAQEPLFTKAKFRKVIERNLARQGKPLGEVREFIRLFLNSPPLMADLLICRCMHDTKRRSNFKAQIFSKIGQPDQAMAALSVMMHATRSRAGV